MKTIVAEGVWCRSCEYFETPDFNGPKCMACGCSASVHADAEVIIEEEA